MFVQAYEELLRVRSQEAAQAKLNLAEVRGVRDVELQELDRLQALVNKKKAEMERKLEEKRTTAAQKCAFACGCLMAVLPSFAQRLTRGYAPHACDVAPGRSCGNGTKRRRGGRRS